MTDITNKSAEIVICSRTNLKESILRTFGADGMVMNKEFVKKVIRRRASKFIGTFMADSLTVRSKSSLITYWVKTKRIRSKNGHTTLLHDIWINMRSTNTFSLQIFDRGSSKFIFSNLCSLLSFWFPKWCRWFFSRILQSKQKTHSHCNKESWQLNSFYCKNII